MKKRVFDKKEMQKLNVKFVIMENATWENWDGSERGESKSDQLKDRTKFDFKTVVVLSQEGTWEHDYKNMVQIFQLAALHYS